MRHTVFFAGMLGSAMAVFGSGCADATKDCKLNPALPCFWDEHGGGEAGAGGGVDPGILIPPETVYVTDNHGKPLPDIPLVVNDEAGAIVLVTQTGADGRANVHVPPGGSVSAFSVESRGVHTMAAPPSGSTVRFSFWVSAVEPAGAGALTKYALDFSNAPTEWAPFEASLDEGCDAESFPLGSPADLDDRFCVGPASHRIIAMGVAFNDAIRWSDITMGSQPGWTFPVALPLEQNSAVTTQVELLGIPGDAANAWIHGGLAGWKIGITKHWEAPISLQLSTPVRIPDLDELDRLLSATLRVKSDTGHSYVRMSRRHSPETLPASVTFDAFGAPWIFTKPVDMTSPEHPVISWDISGPANGDYLSLRVCWVDAVCHSVVLPPEHPGSWRIPDIPDTLAAYRTGGTSVNEQFQVEYYDWDSLDGYADVVDGVPPDPGAHEIFSEGYFGPTW